MRFLIAFLAGLSLLSAGLLAQVPGKQKTVAVISNRNLEEDRVAAESALTILRSRGVKAQLFELDGGASDAAILQEVKRLLPEVVVSMGSYATHRVALAMPGVPTVYTLVPFPEAEGLTDSPNLQGVSPLGLDGSLARLAKAITTEKRVALVYSEAVSASIPSMLKRLHGAGLDPSPFPVSEAPIMEDVLRDLTAHYKVALFLPDPVTANPDRVRFIVTTCVGKGVLTLGADASLVQQGIAAGAPPTPAECGAEAAAQAAAWAMGQGRANEPVGPAAVARWTINSGALKAMRLALPAGSDITYY